MSRLAIAERLRMEQRRVDQLMSQPTDTSPLLATPYRAQHACQGYRPEPIKRCTPQRPLDSMVEQTFATQHPQMYGALLQAYRLKLPFEWFE